MSEYRSLDANPNHVIPRMAFEFDPSGVAELREFALRIPISDVQAAERLPEPLECMPELEFDSPQAIIDGLSLENEGGNLQLTESGGNLEITFGFTPLPPKETVSHTTAQNFFERIRLENMPRMPHLKGRHDIFQMIMGITNIQYQFGIPLDHPSFNPDVAAAPARLSFSGGIDSQEPRFVVTEEFENTRRMMASEVSSRLTNDLYQYLVYLDPHRDQDTSWILGGARVAADGRIFSSGHSSLGQRDGGITKAHLENIDTYADTRIQLGDAYYCRGHNLDDLPSSPRMMAFVTIGGISKLCKQLREATS